MIRLKHLKGKRVMIDEKEICDCNNSGDCIGGGSFIRM